MNGYTKLFQSIITSSIWREDKDTKIVWITMLALANRDGVVDASVPGLADMAKVTLEECVAALEKLEGPDQWSRSTENDGRRVERIEGGWKVLNHSVYRARMSQEDRREYLRMKQREYRQKAKAASRGVTIGEILREKKQAARQMGE